MKNILILSLLLLCGCQDTNSNSYDRDKYSNLGNGSAEFQAAYAVLQSRCISCHFHSSWSQLNTADKWVASGLVVAKKPNESKIIYRTINFGEGSSNMPVGGGALPGNEYQALLDWVEEL